MLYQAKALSGYTLNSRDGTIGKTKEFYFDDSRWTIRYLVADTGSWLTSRLVLISPYALNSVIAEAQQISVDLTQQQIEDSPPWDTNKPVSRQFEAAFHGYYGWPGYWMGNYPSMGPNPAFAIGAQPIPAEASTPIAPAEQEEWDPHLRSTADVASHRIEARDGNIGHVEDFLVDDEAWKIRYLVLDTRNWWPGKKILVSPEWIESIDDEQAIVVVNLTQEEIKTAPEFPPDGNVTRLYESELHEHYGRHGYWIDDPSVRPPK